MTCKPALGYPSRSAAVMALVAQRVPTKEIAIKLGIETKTVFALLHSAARSQHRRDAIERGAEHARTIVFSNTILDRLNPHAARRGMHRNTLARLIVETVLDEGLVDAVLDDAAEIEAAEVNAA